MSGQLIAHLILWILVLLLVAVGALFVCYASDWCQAQTHESPRLTARAWVSGSGPASGLGRAVVVGVEADPALVLLWRADSHQAAP
jgi:hypothetical protein